jgi:hypothetical protein
LSFKHPGRAKWHSKPDDPHQIRSSYIDLWPLELWRSNCTKSFSTAAKPPLKIVNHRQGPRRLYRGCASKLASPFALDLKRNHQEEAVFIVEWRIEGIDPIVGINVRLTNPIEGEQQLPPNQQLQKGSVKDRSTRRLDPNTESPGTGRGPWRCSDPLRSPGCGIRRKHSEHPAALVGQGVRRFRSG